MRIGVLTGGGDVPGLNVCIKEIVHQAEDNGWEVVGIKRGWAGLLRFDIDDPKAGGEWTVPLNRLAVRTVDRTGGTFLHTSRTNPSRVKIEDLPKFLAGLKPKSGEKTVDCTPHVLKVLKHLRLDALVSIGGDDTLSYSVRLTKENFPVVAVPKTMDNDVFGTDYCIGFSTAVTRAADLITSLRTPTGSHERIAVIELFGRNSGESALISGLLAGVDRVLISEVPFDIQRLCKLVVEDRNKNPSRYAMVVLSEGATMIGGDVVQHGEEDAFGHKKLGGIGAMTGDAIKKLTGVDVMNSQLTYVMRAGPADTLDRMVAMSFGRLAIEQLKQCRFGVMMAIQKGCYTTVPLETFASGKRIVDVAELYDPENYRPRIRNQAGKPMFLY